MDDDLRTLLHTTEVEVASPDVALLSRRARRQQRVWTGAVGLFAVVLVAIGITAVTGRDVPRPEIVSSPTDVPTVGEPSSSEQAAPELPAGFEAAATSWTLRAMSPDGTRLVIEFDLETCDRPFLAEVEEAGATVGIDTVVQRPENNGACTLGGGAASGVPTSNHVAIDLDAPLGGRELLGCGRADCAAIQPANLVPSEVQPVVDNLVVLARGREAVAVGAGGDIRWRTTFPADVDQESVLRAGDSTVLVRTRDGGLLSLDPTDGEIRWRVDEEAYGPAAPVLAGGLALLRDRVVFDVVHAVDLATGQQAWRADLPGEPDIGTVAVTSKVEILIGSVAANGIPTVSVLARDSGAVVRTWDVTGGACEGDEPIVDQPPCFGPLVLGTLVGTIGDTVLTELAGIAIQFRDSSGELTTRSLPTDPAATLDLLGDVAVVRRPSTGTLLDDGAVGWTLPLADVGSLVGATDELVLAANGPFVIARTRDGEGDEIWRTSPAVSSEAEGSSATLVAAIPGMLIGIDARTGNVGWWLPDDTASAAPVIVAG